ncbi:flagellar hook-length control protein FliK [Limimaricola sp.]|uniref:flagellar hook-length control protein FliK n=1 Tax=Limimaricola sp. TaxID=2211665 RepID=UPI0040595206
MAQRDQGQAQARTPANTPPFDRLMAQAGNLMRESAARFGAAGGTPETRAAALSDTQTALQGMIAAFDAAHGTEMAANAEALLSGTPGVEAGPVETIAAIVTAMANASGGTVESVMTALNINAPAVQAVADRPAVQQTSTDMSAVQVATDRPAAQAASDLPATPIAADMPAAQAAATASFVPASSGTAPAFAAAKDAARPGPGLAAQVIAAPAAPAQGRSALNIPAQEPVGGGAGMTASPVVPVPSTAVGPPVAPGPGARVIGASAETAPVAIAAAGAGAVAPTRQAGSLAPALVPSGREAAEVSTPAAPSASASASPVPANAPGAPPSFAALIGEAIAKAAETAPDAAASAPDTAARETDLPGGAASSRPQEAVPGPRAAMVPPPAPAPAPAPPSHGFSRALTGQIRGTAFAEGRTRIALTPGGLGEIEIDLAQEAGQLRVVIRAENQGVLQALRDDRDGLAALLGEAGAGVDDDQLSFESFDRRDDAPPRRDRPGGSPAILTDADPETASPDPAQSPVSQGGDGRLDMFT